MKERINMSEKKQSLNKKEMLVKASPIVVWETLTTPKGMERFFSRKAEINLKEGGTARFQVSPTFTQDAHITKVIPFQKLTWEERWPNNETTVVEWSLEFDEKEKKTKITMVSSGFGEFNEGVAWGWETVFRCLKWAVEEGYDRQEQAYLGVRGGLIGMGFQIYDVVPGTPADKAGLQVGDRIQGIGDHTLCGVAWAADVLHHYPAGKTITTRVVRKGDWIPENVEITPKGDYLEMGEQDEI
jgi:uncharacterized protein YndB with AHSA1/START domain